MALFVVSDLYVDVPALIVQCGVYILLFRQLTYYIILPAAVA